MFDMSGPDVPSRDVGIIQTFAVFAPVIRSSFLGKSILEHSCEFFTRNVKLPLRYATS